MAYQAANADLKTINGITLHKSLIMGRFFLERLRAGTIASLSGQLPLPPPEWSSTNRGDYTQHPRHLPGSRHCACRHRVPPLHASKLLGADGENEVLDGFNRLGDARRELAAVGLRPSMAFPRRMVTVLEPLLDPGGTDRQIYLWELEGMDWPHLSVLSWMAQDDAKALEVLSKKAHHYVGQLARLAQTGNQAAATSLVAIAKFTTQTIETMVTSAKAEVLQPDRTRLSCSRSTRNAGLSCSQVRIDNP